MAGQVKYYKIHNEYYMNDNGVVFQYIKEKQDWIRPFPFMIKHIENKFEEYYEISEDDLFLELI